MSTCLSIRPGVYFAAVQGEGVIMDLVEDRYYGLAAQSAAIWRALQEDHTPERIADDVFAAAPLEPPQAALRLIARQLEAWEKAKLVTSQSEVPTDLPNLKPVGIPALAGLDEARIAATIFQPLALFRLIQGVRWSRRALKRRGICWTLKRLQQISVPPAERQPRLEDALHGMVRVYYSFRRILSQGKDDCLPRSLALAVALRRLGVDAEICFGVRKFPFLAHAWLEAGGRVINESPNTMQKYTVLARF